MTAAISPEGYVFIVGGLFFLCSLLTFVLVCAAAMKPRRAQRRSDRPGPITLNEVERFRAELDAEHDLVKAIGGGNCRVTAEDRWAT